MYRSPRKSKLSREGNVSERLDAEKDSLEDITDAFIELRKKLREESDLKALYDQRQNVLRELKSCTEELQKILLTVNEQEFNFDMFLQDQETKKAIEKAELEKQKVLQMKEELDRLKEEYAQRVNRKQKLDLEIQNNSVYSDILARVVKVTEFKEVEVLAVCLRNLLSYRTKLYNQQSEAQDKVYQQKEMRRKLEDQFETMKLEKHLELMQAKTEFDDAEFEASQWEKKWHHIQETSAKTTLFIGNIKMGILNVYEMAGGKLKEGDITRNDTERFVEKIKDFIKDQEDLLKAAGLTEDTS